MTNPDITLDEPTAAVIREALGSAQAGRMADACRIAEQGIAQGGDPGPLYALLGMLRCRNGDLAGGSEDLKRALGERPSDHAIAGNLATALVELRRFDEAAAIATRDRAEADPSLRLARLRAYALQQAERFAEAADAYRAVVAREPEDWESWNNLGNALAASGLPAEAATALRRAIELAPDVPPIHLNLARSLVDTGAPEQAEEVLTAASVRFPQDEHFPLELFALHKRQGRDDAALAALEQAAALRPADASLQVDLAREYLPHLRMQEAEAAFRRAIALDPRNADAHMGLAVVFEHDQPDRLEALTDEAERNGVDPAYQRLLRAYALRRARRFEEAVAQLAADPDSVEPIHRSEVLGQCLDRLGRPDEAFAAFQRMNEALADDPSRPLERAAELRRRVAFEQDLLDPAWAGGWTQLDLSPPERTPVFLVGFPRSGTTLLDTLLMGHPSVEVMEETRGLALIDEHLGGLEKLSGLDAPAIERARALYFAEAAKHVPLARGALLVDKSPLFLNRVPLIRRLFPQARFILALRHPADVLLSCYVSNFRLNAAMSNFLRLDTAAEFYDLTFRYWTKAQQIFAMPVSTVRYEDMVQNPAGTLRPLVEWLGLDWRDELLDHQQTAARRGMVTTASYAQVHEPIYTRSAGRWTRYRDHLAPVLPVLRPWADRFGYTL